MRTAVRWSRKLVRPISAYARWSWRREDATRLAMSSRERSEAYSASTIAVASRNREVRRRVGVGRWGGISLGKEGVGAGLRRGGRGGPGDGAGRGGGVGLVRA